VCIDDLFWGDHLCRIDTMVVPVGAITVHLDSRVIRRKGSSGSDMVLWPCSSLRAQSSNEGKMRISSPQRSPIGVCWRRDHEVRRPAPVGLVAAPCTRPRNTSPKQPQILKFGILARKGNRNSGMVGYVAFARFSLVLVFTQPCEGQQVVDCVGRDSASLEPNL